jgi:hypothetical protein
MTCKNCGAEVNDKFCASCGQRINVKRITFREGWNDFWARVYGFDGMLPRTLRDLTLRPGFVAKKYIDGNRVSYYGPVGYFFLMLTLYLLLMSLLDVDFRDIMKESQKALTPENIGEGQQKVQQVILEFVTENLKLIAFVIMPFNAVAACYVLFRKSGLNFLEHLVTPFYVAGHVYWIGIIALVVYKFSGSLVVNSLNSLVLFFLMGLAYAYLMNYQPKWKAFTKGVFVQLVGMFFSMVLAIVVILILIKVNPELFELIRPGNNR